MKSLFIAMQPMVVGSGISHKIETQYRAFVRNGLNMEFCYQKIEDDGAFSYYIGDNKLCSLGKGFKAHIALYSQYKEIVEYIKRNNIKFVFIRYIQLANPFFNRFLKKLKKHGVVIYMEIPTYPYDGEYTIGLAKKIQKKVERIYRSKFSSSVDKIVTYSLDEKIFDIPTIHISNGLDMDGTPLRTPISHSGFNMVGVAMIKKWHGFDRVIEGIHNYYSNGGNEDIHFYVIGSGDESLDEYKFLVEKYRLEKYVHFEGVKKAEELDSYFDICDIAVGCLACHRKNVFYVKSLKNIEYAARGIRFTYSEENDDFDSQEYVLKQTPDDSPININHIIEFVKAKDIQPQIIRDTVDPSLSWDAQMKVVVNDLKLLKRC